MTKLVFGSCLIFFMIFLQIGRFFVGPKVFSIFWLQWFYYLILFLLLLSFVFLLWRGKKWVKVLAGLGVLFLLFTSNSIWHEDVLYRKIQSEVSSLEVGKSLGVSLKEIMPFQWKGACLIKAYVNITEDYPDKLESMLSYIGWEGLAEAKFLEWGDRIVFKTVEGNIKTIFLNWLHIDTREEELVFLGDSVMCGYSDEIFWVLR